MKAQSGELQFLHDPTHVHLSTELQFVISELPTEFKATAQFIQKFLEHGTIVTSPSPASQECGDC